VSLPSEWENIKQLIHKLILSNNIGFVPINNEKRRSFFNHPVINGKETLKFVAVCIKCKNSLSGILSFPHTNYKNLDRHLASDSHLNYMTSMKEKQKSLLDFINNSIQSRDTNTTNLSNNEKDNLNNTLTRLICLNKMKFQILNNDLFHSFCKQLIKIRAKNGDVVLNSYLNDESSIRQEKVNSLYKEILNKIRENLCKVKYAAAAIDLWKEKHRRKSYLGKNCFYLDGEFKLNKICAGIVRMVGTKSHDQIKLIASSMIENIFARKDVVKHVFADNGSNTAIAFKGITESCSAHTVFSILLVCARCN
jgi:hypothetical protein